MGNIFLNCTKIRELSESHTVLIPENFNWAKDISLQIPKIDLNLPCFTKTSKIHFIQYRKNPIAIYFTDGSKIFCTYDQFIRFPKNLQNGQKLEISYIGNSSSQDPVIVKSIKVSSV